MRFGQRASRLQALARRISGNGCTSWPSPCAQQANGEPEAFLERKRRSVERGAQMGIALTDLNMVAKLTHWQTPSVADVTGGHLNRGGKRKNEMLLPGEAKLAAWPTPNAQDSEGGGQAKRAVNQDRSNDLNDFAQLASWVTPAERDWKDTPGMSATGTNPDGSERTRLDMLPRQAALASWATPNALDTMDRKANRPSRAATGRKEGYLTEQASLTVSGPTPNGSPAATASGGQLNPRHSAWLMGLPLIWDVCAFRAAEKCSSRSSRKAKPASGGSGVLAMHSARPPRLRSSGRQKRS